MAQQQLLDARTVSAAIKSPSMLAALLGLIKESEAKGDYNTRNTAVLHAVVVAQLLGIPAGIRFDPNEADWPVAMIELPMGQVSWHLQKHDWAWDGHTTEQKWERADAYVARVRGMDTPMMHSAADYLKVLKYDEKPAEPDLRQLEIDAITRQVGNMRAGLVDAQTARDILNRVVAGEDNDGSHD